MHYRALRTLRKVSIGLSEFGDQHSGVCRGCALGKNDKRPFQSNDSKAKGILDLIHSDLCGPMSVDTLSGFSYFVTFINDYSRKTWIYFLKTRNPMKCWIDSRSLKHLWKIRPKEGLECFDQTMVESTPQENSLLSVGEQELRGSLQFRMYGVYIQSESQYVINIII